MKNGNVFLNILTRLDLFGQGIELNIDKQLKTQTALGGFFSFIMIVLLLAMLVFSSQDVIYKQNPVVSRQDIIDETFPVMNLNTSSYPIAFSLTGNTNGAFFNPAYFKVEAVYTNGLTAEDLNYDRVNFSKCTKEDFHLISQEVYDTIGLSEMFCLPNQNVNISGSWGSEYLAYMTFQISRCVNSTSSDIICASYDEVTNYINSEPFFWNLYYVNTNINTQKASDPITYNIVNFYKQLKNGASKTVEIFIKRQILISDDGVMFKSKNSYQSLVWDFDMYDDSKEGDDQILVMFNIFVSPHITVLHRNYMKIQAVLASVGGLGNLLRVLLFLFCIVFSKLKRDELILNRIFDFDLSGLNPSSKIKKKIKDIKILHNSSKLNNSQLPGINFDEINNQTDRKHSFNLTNRSKTGHNFTSLLKSSILSSPIKQIKSENKNLGNKIISNISSHKINFDKEKKINKIEDENSEKSKVKRSVLLTQRKEDEFDKNIRMNSEKLKHVIKKKEYINEAKEFLNNLQDTNNKSQLTFTLFEIFVGFFLCKPCHKKSTTYKKKLFKKSFFVIEEYLDITYIVQKLEEFEKFKLIMLSNDQLALFSFISKELISLDVDRIREHGMTNLKLLNKDKEKLAQLIIDFRKKIRSNAEVNQIDRKLFELINIDFK
jgi:hypothetical protein